MYLAEVMELADHELAAVEARYHWAWERFVRHGLEMQRLVAHLDDLGFAADLWNSINQLEAHNAFTTVLCEREPMPRANLATVAMRHYELSPITMVGERDRKLTAADNQEAWRQSKGGLCRGCGTATISQREHDRLRRVLAANSELFKLTPTYRQANGRVAPLWSNRILIAAKGVADHLVPWCQGGTASQANLRNVCAGCNYSRSNTSLDTVRVAAYR